MFSNLFTLKVSSAAKVYVLYTSISDVLSTELKELQLADEILLQAKSIREKTTQVFIIVFSFIYYNFNKILECVKSK